MFLTIWHTSAKVRYVGFDVHCQREALQEVPGGDEETIGGEDSAPMNTQSDTIGRSMRYWRLVSGRACWVSLDVLQTVLDTEYTTYKIDIRVGQRGKLYL